MYFIWLYISNNSLIRKNHVTKMIEIIFNQFFYWNFSIMISRFIQLVKGKCYFFITYTCLLHYMILRYISQYIYLRMIIFRVNYIKESFYKFSSFCCKSLFNIFDKIIVMRTCKNFNSSDYFIVFFIWKKFLLNL